MKGKNKLFSGKIVAVILMAMMVVTTLLPTVVMAESANWGGGYLLAK